MDPTPPPYVEGLAPGVGVLWIVLLLALVAAPIAWALTKGRRGGTPRHDDELQTYGGVSMWKERLGNWTRR